MLEDKQILIYIFFSYRETSIDLLKFTWPSLVPPKMHNTLVRTSRLLIKKTQATVWGSFDSYGIT